MSLDSSSRNLPLPPADAASLDAAGRVPANKPVSASTLSTRPPLFYRAGWWRACLRLASSLPARLAYPLAASAADFYLRISPRRKMSALRNLLPVVNGDRARAEMLSRRLFRNFAIKLVDLWRFEAGRPVDNLFTSLTGWEHFLAAEKQGRGVLVVTPHLGNWEFGGPLLTRRGFRLQVITLSEPGRGLTEFRRRARARWDIETLVIGEDPFAFVEVIRRLESGASVALLIDRPPPASAIVVELFNRPFMASVAAAELARASGCVVLPVYLPRNRDGYAAHLLPPVDYDRAALRHRETRRQFTQEILQAFEPAIRQHPDQWYHFVPVWPEDQPAQS